MLLAGVAVAGLSSLATMAAPAGGGGDAGAAGAAPTWVRYFFPLQVGWTCHESLDAAGVTGAETLTVASVGSVPQGRSVTVDEGSSTTAGGTSVPTNAALHYVLTKGGQLISVPSGVQVAGQPYSITGNTTFPSVRTLLSGGSAASRLHIALPLNAADRAELQAVLPDGATSLEMAVDLRQSGNSVPTLQTSMGTFHNVLSVHSVLRSIAFTNVTKAASKELVAAIKPAIAKELSIMAWYAPGIGPIKTSADGYTSSVTSCGPSGG
jgi:hypothetical protein